MDNNELTINKLGLKWLIDSDTCELGHVDNKMTQ